MDVEIFPRLSGYKKRIWSEFLHRAELTPDADAESTVLIWEQDTLIATGSRLGNLLKCIAVDPQHQGEGLTGTLLTSLRKDAFQHGHRHLFLYTKPENEALFTSLFFYPVAKTKQVLLMENERNGITAFLDTLPAPNPGEIVGAAVMNCNPFTLGHRYLIETAAKECDCLYVFVVSENRSQISYTDRMKMVQLGTQDLPNVTVLPTGSYLISSATFPTYFLKDRDKAGEIQCHLDIQIFGNYFAPKFSICRRYVGTEPLSPMTAQYNAALKELLPGMGIELRELPRLETDMIPISASAARTYMDAGNRMALRSLVPDTTFQYLLTHHYL